MSKKVKFTALQKLQFLFEYRKKNIPLVKFCKEYQVEATGMKRWMIKYDAQGFQGLEEILKKTKYSSNTMLFSVDDYLQKKGSMIEIVKKYQLSSDNVLRMWLSWYNTPKWKQKVGEAMAREKIDLSQKIECVLKIVNQEATVMELVAALGVSAYQLRDWVRKYKKDGEKALEDSRGSRKDWDSLTEEEKWIRKSKELEKENERLKVEIAYLKKLEELKRRGT